MTNNNQPGTGMEVTKVDRLKVVLAADSVQTQFRNVLGKNSDAFAASIIDLYVNDSYLQQCDPNHVIMQALKAAILKLPVVKSLGMAFIVPYKKGDAMIPEFQLGWKGLVQLAIRSGQYRIINVDEVYEGEFVLKNKLTGEFDLSGKKVSDTVIGYFAHFELKNGFSKTLYMTVAKVTAHAAKYSKSYNSQYSPWKTEFAEMAKKTLIRLLLGKFGLLSVELSQAMGDDDIADTVEAEILNNANKNAADFQQAVVIPNGGQGNQQTGGGNAQHQPAGGGQSSHGGMVADINTGSDKMPF